MSEVITDFSRIRCELSHAYLQTVVAHIGSGCERSTSPSDNMGFDATVNFEGNWSKDPRAEHTFSIKFQIKSTSTNFTSTQDKIGYRLDVENYNKYIDRSNARDPFLVLLMILPPENEYLEWLTLTADKLVLKKCMYWTTLRGAEKANVSSTKTLYFPKENLFTVENLKKIILPTFAEGRYFSYGD